MPEGPQTLPLEERNASPYLNLLGGGMSPMAGETCSSVKWRLLILSALHICKHYAQRDLCAWADEVDKLYVLSSAGHKPLNLSWHRRHRGGTVLPSIEVSLVLQTSMQQQGGRGCLSQLNTCFLGDSIMPRSGTRSGGTCTRSRAHSSR